MFKQYPQWNDGHIYLSLSNNLNVVVKLLTAITIILMIPTLVASIYGMNVKLPFQDNQHAFLIIIGISFVLSVIGIFIL